MRETNKNLKTENPTSHRPHHTSANRGITLIALVITIIVMLILVAVTITVAVNGGLFGYAGSAAEQTKTARDEEQDLANVGSDLTTDQIIAKYTTNNAEDLAKLKKAYIDGDSEISKGMESDIQNLAWGEGWECIKYRNNVYLLTHNDSKPRIYTNVEPLIEKLDVTQYRSASVLVEITKTINMRQKLKSEVFEDFTISCDDTRLLTIDGYNITAGNTEGKTTIVLTGKTSGKTKNFQVNVHRPITGDVIIED